jgi:excisionase family DNA binding protein
MHDVIAEGITGMNLRKHEPASDAASNGSRLGVPQDLITPGEVASLFCVHTKTVTRWAAAGHLTAYRTLGGHRRYSRAQIEQLLTGHQQAS